MEGLVYSARRRGALIGSLFGYLESALHGGLTMTQGNELALRLQWARVRRGLTLTDVSQRTGLATGYIAQLENGHKGNPTISVILDLSRALNVTVAFLVGEIDTPKPEKSDVTVDVRRSLVSRIKCMPPAEQAALRKQRPEEKFCFVVRFLENSGILSRTEIASVCGITVRALNDIVERGYSVSPFTWTMLCKATGIEEQFIRTGQFTAD